MSANCHACGSPLKDLKNYVIYYREKTGAGVLIGYQMAFSSVDALRLYFGGKHVLPEWILVEVKL